MIVCITTITLLPLRHCIVIVFERNRSLYMQFCSAQCKYVTASAYDNGYVYFVCTFVHQELRLTCFIHVHVATYISSQQSGNLRGTNTCFCFKLIKFQSKFYGNTYAPTLFYHMTICITTDIISHCLSISQHIYFLKRQMREHRRKSTVCLASLRCTSRNVKEAVYRLWVSDGDERHQKYTIHPTAVGKTCAIEMVTLFCYYCST